VLIEFDKTGLDIQLVDGVRHCWQATKTQMKTVYDCRWSSTLLNSERTVAKRLRDVSMEFDIVDGYGNKQTALDECWRSLSGQDLVQLVDGVQHCWQATCWETITERRAEENCWITWLRHYEQGLRQFGYYPLRNDRTRWKFVDQTERWKSLRQLSLCENELQGRQSTVSLQTTMTWVERSAVELDGVLVQTNSEWI